MKGEIRFDERVVVVTGAGNGLGPSHALELGRRGALIVVNDYGGSTDGTGGGRRAADFLADEIVAAGGRAAASHDSVRQDAACRNIAALAFEAGGRIDAVIHNAGISRNTTFVGMDDEHWFPEIESHLLGGFYLARAVWPAMADAGCGRFVITSSATGMWGRVESANYGAAKAGLVGLCNVLALEGEAKGILANAIMPVASTRLGKVPEDSDTTAEAEAARARALEARSLPEWVTPMVVLHSQRPVRPHPSLLLRDTLALRRDLQGRQRRLGATSRRTTHGRTAGRVPRHRRGPVRLQRAQRQPRRGSHRVTADCLWDRTEVMPPAQTR